MFLMRTVACVFFLLVIFSAYSQQKSTSPSRKYSKEKRDQFIDFDYLGKVQIGNGEISMELRDVSSCGLPLEFASSDPSVAVVQNSRLVIKGAGVAEITITQDGNEYFKPVRDVRQIHSYPLKQVIEINQIGDLPLSHEPLNLVAKSSSGLPMEFSSISPAIKISGSRISFVKEGEVIIKATQLGNKLFLPAESILKFNVLPLQSNDQDWGQSKGNSEESRILSLSTNNSFNTLPIELFPNPANEKLHIELAEISEHVELLVYDTRGNEILDNAYVKTDLIEVELNSLTPGMYCVIMRNSKGVYSGKFIKK